MDINSLWELGDENRWLDALNRYWANSTVCKNRDTGQFVDKVELEYVQRLDTQQWYDFLNKYFRWKFMGNHLHERLMDLGRNSSEHLFSVKRSLVAIDELDLADSQTMSQPCYIAADKGTGCIGSARTDIQGMVRNR